MTDETTEQTSELDISYTDAMSELETILAELEQPDVDIDALADRVQRAALLVAHCRGRLESARLRVNEIVADLELD